MTPTTHEKAEWARMAQDCYSSGQPCHGHRYAANAALPDGATLRDDVYDQLMRLYRAWLIGGVDAIRH